MNAIELWKPFPADTRYEISTFGKIRNAGNLRIMKLSKKQNGYLGIVFYYYTKEKRIAKAWDAHTIIAMTWLGPKPLGLDTSHKDGNKLNNHIDNLVYETRSENMARKNFVRYTGGRKLKAEDVIAIRSSSFTNKELSIMYGVKASTIWRVRKRIDWKHI